MMWKPVDFYLVCLFCLLFVFYFLSTLSPSLFSFQFHLPPFFFPRSSSFVVGLRVLLTLPGVAGFPARHRQESDRSEVRPSGTYIIIDDNTVWTHSRTSVCSDEQPWVFPLPVSPWVFLFCLDLSSFSPASFTRPYRSQAVSVAGGIRFGWGKENPQSESCHAYAFDCPLYFLYFPLNSDGQTASEASLPPFNLLFIIPLFIPRHFVHLFLLTLFIGWSSLIWIMF